MRENMGDYRGKRIDNGKWVEGFLAHEQFCNVGVPYIGYVNGEWVEVDPSTVGQFTGFDGLYEDDLCETNRGSIVQIVWYKNHAWGCKIVKTDYVLTRGLTFPLWQWDKSRGNDIKQTLRKIGNIHDNPELLEVK